MSSLPARIKKIQSKTTEKRCRHRFSHYKSMGAFCCHGNQSFDLICPKTLCSLSPTPVMLHIKFDLGWPAGFRDIQVWKCGRRRTDDGPLLYYKLTLWAFGSGELKIPASDWPNRPNWPSRSDWPSRPSNTYPKFQDSIWATYNCKLVHLSPVIPRELQLKRIL